MPKGIPNSGVNKGWFGQKPPWNKGLKMSEEFCKNRSKTMKSKVIDGSFVSPFKDPEVIAKWKPFRGGTGNPMYGKCGSLSPNWKGGISCEPYCFEWSSKEFKEYIKERDGHKCLNPDCFGNVSKLTIHHIDYNKKNCDPQNLITLCRSCNSRANKDREWHKAWYEVVIYRRYKYTFR